MRGVIDRRNLLLTSAAAAAAFPALVREAQAATEFLEWHDVSAAEHLKKRSEAYAQNYRELSLSMHGDPAAPRYTAVMFKSATPFATEQVNWLTSAQLTAKVLQLGNANPKWAPVLVCATGPVASATFSAVFVPSPAPALFLADLDQAALRATEPAARTQNLIPLVVDAYGTADDPRYCAIWTANADSSLWCLEAIDEDTATVQQRFNAIASVGGRSSMLAITPSGRYLHGFTEGSVGAWEARGDMTAASYEAKVAALKAKGLVPTRVSAETVGGTTRYAAIFQSTLAKDKRITTIEAPLGSPANSAIDNSVLTEMAVHGIRQASLAITLGTRLVYARGYTFAEANYPLAKPHTLYRLASVSKTFAAVAAWRLMQDDSSFTLDTKVQDVLQLKAPTGSLGQGFKDVTVRHLLESTSGVISDLAFASVVAAAAAKHSLPAMPRDLANYAAGFACQFAPGDTTKVTYSNMGYILLGQVIAAKAGVATFEDAVKKLVAGPLKMTTRGAVCLREKQLANEARYDFMGTGANARVSGAPLVPYQYGCLDVENFGGAGGLSASAIDVARLMAMFSAGADTPVLKLATMQSMFVAGLTASKTYSGPDAHGYHGFDRIDDKTVPGVAIASKGGAFSGATSYFVFAPGGFGITLLINRSKNSGVQFDWLTPVANAALAQFATDGWGTIDLFQQQLFKPEKLSPAVKKFKVPLKLAPAAVMELQQRAFEPRARGPAQKRGRGL